MCGPTRGTNDAGLLDSPSCGRAITVYTNHPTAKAAPAAPTAMPTFAIVASWLTLLSLLASVAHAL